MRTKASTRLWAMMVLLALLTNTECTELSAELPVREVLAECEEKPLPTRSPR